MQVQPLNDTAVGVASPASGRLATTPATTTTTTTTTAATSPNAKGSGSSSASTAASQCRAPRRASAAPSSAAASPRPSAAPATTPPVDSPSPPQSPPQTPAPAPALTPAAAAAGNAPTRSGYRHSKTVLSFREKGGKAGAPREVTTAVLSSTTESSATTAAMAGPLLRYRTDLDKQTLHFMFERLGRPAEEIYVQFRDEDERDANTGVGDWNFFWMSVSRIRNVFSTADFRLHDNQIINHFPNHTELTRKDLMYKNIKRYLRENSGPVNGRKLTLLTAADWVAGAANAANSNINSCCGSSSSNSPGDRLMSPALPSPSAAATGSSGYSSGGYGSGSGGGGGSGGPGRKTAFNFADSVPITYNIPNDLSMFIEEFKRHPGATWIVKPTARSQGRGIFLINRIQQLTRWIREKKDVEGDASSAASSAAAAAAAAAYAAGGSPAPFRVTGPATCGATVAEQAGIPALTPEAEAAAAADKARQEHASSLMGTFIVSRYVANPLLIGGKKFDMRLYVLVTSYKPLVAYLHDEGFARFCATKYASNSLSDDDLASHLTNVALQKGDDAYNTTHGGKWSLKNLFLYIQGRYGPYTAEGLMKNIKFLIFHSLKAMESVMFNDKHSFELYGYDILVDDQIKPHLIEVNASPSLSNTTTSDRLLKEEVLVDMLKIVVPPGFPSARAPSYFDHRTRTDLTAKLNTGFKLLQF